MKYIIRSAVADIAYGFAPRLTAKIMYERHLRIGRTESEVHLLPLLCDRARVSLDVGACHGTYSFHMNKFSRKVLCFEPNRENLEILNRRMPPSVEIYNFALSDATGTAILRVPSDRGCCTIEPANGLSGLGAVSTQRTEARRLDDLLLPGSVGFMKIDVEGHELAVLRGGLKVLERDHPRLLIEIEERHRPRSLDEVGSLVEGLGYRGYFFDGSILHPIDEFDPSRHQQTNTHPYINNFVFSTTNINVHCL